MKRLAFAFFCLVLPVSASGSAFASTLFDFSFTGATFSGSGMFTTTALSATTYRITDVSGSVDTGAGAPKTIAGVLATGSFEGNDNVLTYPGLFGGTDFFDAAGVSFGLGNGAEVNLYSVGGAILMRAGGGFAGEDAVFSVSPVATATPEPGTFALLGTGALGVAGAVRRRLSL